MTFQEYQDYISVTLNKTKNHSEKVSYMVSASLPYPLRLEGGPYEIRSKLGVVELSFETVRQESFDPRLLIESGKFDFEIDRYGWASYSRFSGVVTTSGTTHPLNTLVACLNQLIRNLRDVLNYYWLYDLEQIDLFHVSVDQRVDSQEKVHARRDSLC